MEYDGHPGHNWTVWILMTIFRFPHKTADETKDKYCGGTLNTSWAEYPRKNKILKVNSSSTASVTLEDEAIEEVEHFTYFGSVVDTQGWTEADVTARIEKARVPFLQLKNI